MGPHRRADPRRGARRVSSGSRARSGEADWRRVGRCRLCLCGGDRSDRSSADRRIRRPTREIPRILQPEPSTYVAMRSVLPGECVVISDWDTEVRLFERAWLQLGPVKSSAFLPIRTSPGGRVFGFLGIHATHAREFPEQEIIYLEIVANVLGGAIAREQAREVAAQYVRQFRALAENSPDIVSRFDRDLRIIYVNGTVERLTGLPASEIVGRTLRDMR